MLIYITQYAAYLLFRDDGVWFVGEHGEGQPRKIAWPQEHIAQCYDPPGLR